MYFHYLYDIVMKCLKFHKAVLISLLLVSCLLVFHKTFLNYEHPLLYFRQNFATTEKSRSNSSPRENVINHSKDEVDSVDQTKKYTEDRNLNDVFDRQSQMLAVGDREHFLDTSSESSDRRSASIMDKEYAVTCNQSHAATVNQFKSFKTQQDVTQHLATLSEPLKDDSTDCPRSLSRVSPSFPSIALMTFPGSGNTWMRHILQQLTGIATGSIYMDPRLKSQGFSAEGRVSRVLVVKTHGISYNQTRRYIPYKKFDRSILVIRNVYNSILSEVKRKLLAIGHRSNHKIDTSKMPKWREFLVNHLTRWKAFMKEAFDFNGPLLVVFYEDLTSNLLTQMLRLVEFLKNDELTKFSICCALREEEGIFHRKRLNQTSENIYSIKEKILVDSKIKEIASFLYELYPDVSNRLLDYLKVI